MTKYSAKKVTLRAGCGGDLCEVHDSDGKVFLSWLAFDDLRKTSANGFTIPLTKKEKWERAKLIAAALNAYKPEVKPTCTVGVGSSPYEYETTGMVKP